VRGANVVDSACQRSAEPQGPGAWVLLQFALATLLGSALILGVSATLATMVEGPAASLEGPLPLQHDGKAPAQSRPHEWREARQSRSAEQV